MATNKLFLRSTASPYTFPIPDVVKGSTLTWAELDNNLIFLKGLNVRNGTYDSGTATITLNRINGDIITITGITGGSSGSTLNTYVSGGTYSGDTILFTNTTGGTFSVTGITGGGSGATMFTSTDNFVSGVTQTISHNLGSSDVMVQLNYNDELIFGEVTNFQTNSVDVTLNQTLNNVKTHVLGGPITAISGGTGTDTYVTGGTYSGNEIVFTNNSGGTFSVTGITAGGTGTTSGNTIFSSTDNYVSGVTQTITHNLNSVDVLAQLIDTNENEMVIGYIDNYQLNSVDVTLSDTLNDIKIVIVGGPVSGGTGSGSTSPAGSDTWVQYNDAGSFGATSGLTWDGGQNFDVVSDFSGKTHIFSVGNTTLPSFGEFPGVGLSYKNPLSAGTTGVWAGDLTNISGQDNHTVMGYFDLINDTRHLFSLSPEDVSLVSKNNSGQTNSFSMLGGDPIQFQMAGGSGGTINFLVRDGVGTRLLDVGTDGSITFNENYTFPLPDGSNGQVLTTDGSGNVSWSTISGGSSGTSIIIAGSGNCSTIRGGIFNTASGAYATAFGYQNDANSYSSTIAGGGDNTASNNYASIGGGMSNQVTGQYGVVSGGRNNTASGNETTIGGGRSNSASGQYSTVSGGYFNIASGNHSFIGGGYNNCASGSCATIGGGRSNTASGLYSTVGGGFGNVASGSYSAILGGCGNTASGAYSSVLGGVGLTASFNTAAVPNLDINGDLRFIGTSTATTATIGTGGAIPSSAATYVTITLDGTNYKLPLFNT